jgi:hypothetical protein
LPYSPECLEEVFSEIRSGLQLVASCMWWKGMTRFRAETEGGGGKG